MNWKLLLFAALTILAPIKATLIAVMFLTVVDLFTGIVAALKRGEQVKSWGLRRTTVKIFIYEIVTILGFITETYLTGPGVPVVQILAGFIGLTELKSVIENLESITNEPILKTLIDRLSSTTEK